MGHVAITFRAEHSETSRVPLDEAVEVFTDTLRMRGYRGAMLVDWGDGEPSEDEHFGTSVMELEVEDLTDMPTTGPLPGYTYEHKGGGYYDILVDGEVVDTVKGKAAAEAWTP